MCAYDLCVVTADVNCGAICCQRSRHKNYEVGLLTVREDIAFPTESLCYALSEGLGTLKSPIIWEISFSLVQLDLSHRIEEGRLVTVNEADKQNTCSTPKEKVRFGREESPMFVKESQVPWN